MRYLYLFFLSLPSFIFLFSEGFHYPWYIDNLQSVPKLIYLYYFFGFIFLLYKKEAKLLIALIVFFFIFHPLHQNKNNVYKGIKENKDFSVFQYNMFFNEDALVDTVKLVYKTEPDFIVLQEVTKEIGIRAYNQFKEKYPYVVGIEPKEGFPSQQLFMSKYPILNVKIKEFSKRKYRFIEAIIKIKNKEILFYVMHPPSPKNKRDWGFRNMLLEEANNTLISQHRAFVLIGDLNISQSSNSFRHIFKRNDYNFNILEEGYTWRAFCIPYINSCLLSSKIDHVITSKFIYLKEKKVFRNYRNSDHFPIYSEFLLH